jgi:hypothetical protein
MLREGEQANFGVSRALPGMTHRLGITVGGRPETSAGLAALRTLADLDP